MQQANVERAAWILAIASPLACTSHPGGTSPGQEPRDGAAQSAPNDAATGAFPADSAVPRADAEAVVGDGSVFEDASVIEGASEAGATDGALTFDLGADFSFVRNPNGPWRYGYTTGQALDPGQFALDQLTTFSVDSGDPIAFWHPYAPATVTDGYYPYVAENGGPVAASEEASWALVPGQVAMEGSNTGQYAVVEFVVPLAGTYQVHAHYEGIHFRLSTTDVHVLANDAGLFTANIDGYGGDPAFHAMEGGSPTADYAGALVLNAGDVLSFAIGYGSNMTNYNDTTGLTVHIVVQ